MPLLGAHVSIAGGVHKSITRALDIDCDTFQIFTKNQRQWRTSALEKDIIASFKLHLEDSGLGPVIAHDSYLINLGAPKDEVFQRSVNAFADELRRCSQLDIGYLVAHPGSHLGEGEKKGIEKIATGIDKAWDLLDRTDVMILLETTAGQGTNIGYRFEQLAQIRELASFPERIGVCFDTCHVFAAGYDISTDEGYSRTMSEFKAVFPISSLKAIHINDSKKGLGSRVDRHDNLGDGMIGTNGFRNIVNDPDLQNVPMILETPGGDDAYRKNLELLRSLVGV